ncbi:hypothetical protein EMN47_11245 [Prolixibacteraceae bacterium JC049]|nr:hypothetical protein [Prolixibacteraceae bacterium JC049]
MRWISKFLMITLLISCFTESKNKQIDNNQNEFNQIVDKIVRYKLNRVSVVQIETMPICKLIPIDSSYMNSHDYPPPPPPDLINYSKDFFSTMIERNLIDSIDANYMYSIIDSSLVIKIDSSLISKPTLTKQYLGSLFNKDIDYAYDYLEKRFGASCFIRVGTPVFNKARTKLILAINYYCGPLDGQGYIFILKKENNKWMIIEELGTWES